MIMAIYCAMDFKSRSSLLAMVFGVATMLPHVPAFAQPPTFPFQPDEKLMVDIMKAKNVEYFLMLNKQKGQILLIADGKIIQKVSALSGRKKGDATDTPMTTPAGIFPLNITSDQSDPNAALIFYQRKDDTVDVIHRVINIAGENREKRLQSSSASFKRVSHGCINLSPKDYITVSNFANNSPSVLTTPTGEKILPQSYLVVLPERTTPSKFFGMPTHQFPQ